MHKWWIALWLAAALLARAEPVALRVVAANLTSDKHQTYSPDNGNHSNPEGAGARILKALQPDVVLIQEFNTSVPVRQWVNSTLGKTYAVAREEQPGGIPNGVISRYPIIASGAWDDPQVTNRELFWARIALPNGRELWAVSLHLHAKSADSRARSAAALVAQIRNKIPKDALLVVGGDLNTRHENEPCLATLKACVVVPDTPPVDGHGNPATNSPRNRPYDWVLAGPALEKFAVPVILAELTFPHGLVFDSRVFEPLAKLPPVQKGDSALPMMQHMAVVRDFLLPPPPPPQPARQ
jgi:hypothetical protein